MKKILFWAVAMMMQLSVMAQEAPAIEVNESGASAADCVIVTGNEFLPDALSCLVHSGK